MEEEGASLLRAIPYTAASYTTIGIGERHTDQACVLGSLGGDTTYGSFIYYNRYR
jgi:hypothetical protein